MDHQLKIYTPKHYIESGVLSINFIDLQKKIDIEVNYGNWMVSRI